MRLRVNSRSLNLDARSQTRDLLRKNTKPTTKRKVAKTTFGISVLQIYFFSIPSQLLEIVTNWTSRSDHDDDLD